MSLPSTGAIRFSDLRAQFVTALGATPLSRFYKCTNGVPSSGTLSMSTFRGKGRLGLGTAAFPSTYNMNAGYVFRITGNGLNRGDVHPALQSAPDSAAHRA